MSSVQDLIARKSYAKALDLIQADLRRRPGDHRLRLRQADVLILAGRDREAVPVLLALADEHASEGFAAKAIAVLKRIEKIAPGRRDVEERLAHLIQEKVSAAPTPGGPMPELGMEEIGIDAAPASAPAAEVGPVFEVEPEPLVAEPEPLDADASRPAAEPIADDDLEGLDYLASAEEDAASADSPPPDPLLSTPLFQGFSKEELLAVMRGMSLRTFDAGDILVAEGAPGDSLFVLTTGSVKCWVKDAAGQYVKVHEFPEGAFFGEISILTGRPRTATLTAAGACEVLELDKAAFDDIAARHPHVVEVLRKFHEQRAIDTVQALSRKTRR